jgi:hypothetical protein
LVEVPWAVIEGDRRQIIDDGVRSHTQTEVAEVEERLRKLGYK